MAMSGPDDPLLVCLDVNVLVSHFLALRRARNGTLASRIVCAVRDRRFGHTRLQLAMSQEMLGTVERVLLRLGIDEDVATAFVDTVVDMMRTGPAPMDPFLLVAGRDQLTARDREDAGVIASAILVRADLLITDNLDDFRINDCEIIPTRSVTNRRGEPRDLYAVLVERADRVRLVIAHPVDVEQWLREGIRPSPDAIRKVYAGCSGRR